MGLRRRHIVLGLLLILDIGALGFFTWWLTRKGPVVVKPIASRIGSITSHSSGSDGYLSGGPKYIISGAADLFGNVWLGSEDQGLWSLGQGGWQQFGTEAGLGDNDATAVAVDAMGRIWVGQSAHGLSIYDGQEWRRYDRFAGPGGSHVFCIATCPTDGDVWIGTGNGITRYSLKAKTWKTYDRADGMSACIANAIAFDSKGNIFIGTQANGVVMAKSHDDYKTWTSVTGPDEMPIVQSGQGLPSPLVNAMAVCPDDTVYAGTCRGLAHSSDQGTTWSYMRGKNWPTQAKGRYIGVPKDFDPADTSPLAEDWITSLAVDDAGVLWVGYRDAGYASFSHPGGKADHVGHGRVSVIVPQLGTGCIVGTYGNGTIQSGTFYTGPTSAAATALSMPLPTTGDPLPPNAAPPDISEIEALTKTVEALPPGKDGVDFLDDDWQTIGNWEGRYGSALADLCGFKEVHSSPSYSVASGVGPYRKGSRYYLYGGDADKYSVPRGLLDPATGRCEQSEYNDGSFNTRRFPTWEQGPDLYVRVQLPGGTNLVSLYFHNFDGHSRSTAERDFPILVKRTSTGSNDDDSDENDYGAGGGVAYLSGSDTVAAELSPTLARARVPLCWCGVYKRFIIRGAGVYWFKVDRNYSICTKIQGVFIDWLDKPMATDPLYPQPPAAKDYTHAPGLAGAAARLWAALNASVGRQGYDDIAARARTDAYRAAVAAGIDSNTLTAWRWRMPQWQTQDVKQFDRYVAGLRATHK